MTADETTPSLETVKKEIARDIAKIHEDSYGERVSNLEVGLHDTFVTIVMEIEFSRAEKTLVDAGNFDSVKTTREAYQLAIAPTFIAVVERATGRRVGGFVSRTDVDGDRPWSAEIFRLLPEEHAG
jgi:uncharacterized protein YbcI